MQHWLIVDDSEIVRRYTRLILEDRGHRVTEADCQKAAFARLEVESPDFIMIDWRIPGENMIDFIAWVRQLELKTRPHIMYLTTENDAEDVEKAMSVGADSQLLKPFNKELLEMKLHELRLAA